VRTHREVSAERFLSRYDYSFPKKLIAQTPAVPRENARLLVYPVRNRTAEGAATTVSGRPVSSGVYRRSSDKVAFGTFSNIARYLPPRAVLIFNRTKVIPARLTLKKETGGKAHVLFLGIEENTWKCLSDRKLTVGSRLSLGKSMYVMVRRQRDKYYFLKPSFPIQRTLKILERFGKTPLPPYIKHSPLSESKLREKYQTVFAKIAGSVAAPTASLHFSKTLLQKLRQAEVAVRFVTLHVNLGTFAPLTDEQLKRGALHSELCEIDAPTAAFLNKARKEKRPIIAVGTTVVRTLESSCDAKGHMRPFHGATDLFIREGYRFRFVDGIITNFHVPRSSLLMLVSAFVGREKTLELYRLAVKKRFRLFSFGDGMLLL